jgi:hypothetical protein
MFHCTFKWTCLHHSYFEYHTGTDILFMYVLWKESCISVSLLVLFSGWKPYVNESARLWLEMAEDWLNFTGDLHILRYEKLKADPINEIKSLLNFLQISISQKELTCVLENMKGRFKRPFKNLTDYDPYSAEMRSTFLQFEKQINRTIDKRFRYTTKSYT